MAAKKPRLTKAQKQILSRVRVPPIAISHKIPHRDGTVVSEGTAHCDQLIRVHAKDRYDLWQKLQTLGDQILGTDMPDFGSSDIYLLIRRM